MQRKNQRKRNALNQYTVRAVPADLDSALRKLARQNAKSLNQLILEILRQASLPETGVAPKRYTDLDHLVGTWQEDPEFDEAIKQQEKIDKDAWNP